MLLFGCAHAGRESLLKADADWDLAVAERHRTWMGSFPSRLRGKEAIEAEYRASVEAPPRRPGVTYRLQLHKRFRLDDVTAIVV